MQVCAPLSNNTSSKSSPQGVLDVLLSSNLFSAFTSTENSEQTGL